MRIYIIAKHASDKSHTCYYCMSNLKPVGFSKNKNHHFPLGIDYKCSCGKSHMWTNSVRSYNEFKTIVFEEKPWKSYWSGFCNDIFCGKCLVPNTFIVSELLMDDKRSLYYERKKEGWKLKKVLNLKDVLIDKNSEYVNNLPDIEEGSVFMESVEGKIRPVKWIDIGGCINCNNCGIIRNGYDFEYGEGEYTPIYNWIKANKSKIPSSMIEEIKENSNWSK